MGAPPLQRGLVAGRRMPLLCRGAVAEHLGRDELQREVLVVRHAVPDDRRPPVKDLAAHFLALLTADYAAFVPSDPVKKNEYIKVSRPLVRYRLLEALRDAMNELANRGAAMQ